MKINCVLIGLTFCIAGCGGGGGSGAAGGISVQTPAPIEFSDGTTVLSEDKMHVSVGITGGCGHLLRQIGKIIWGSIQAAITPISRDAIKTMSRFRGSLTTHLLSNFWGILNRLGGRLSYAMTENLIS